MTSSSSLSSASFCSLRPTSCKAAATAPSVSSTAQPASLPAMSLRRSRSTSSASATLTPPVPPPAQPLQVSQLEQHCRNLEGQLDSVKSEIIKILSDKTVASRENESLRHYASAYEELRTENEALRKELAQLNKLMVDPPKSPALSTSSKASSSDPQNVDRSSPDGQEELDTTSSSSTAEDTSKTDISKAEDDPKEDHASLESPESPIKADAILTKRCEELEESLELMRNEFENMEDYWQVGSFDFMLYRSSSLVTTELVTTALASSSCRARQSPCRAPQSRCSRSRWHLWNVFAWRFQCCTKKLDVRA